MKQLRLAAFAAVAGLAFLPGCCCIGQGQMLSRMGLCPQQNCCECSTCGSTPLGDGPLLGDPTGPYLVQPGVQELPPPRLAPQAQPTPAGPVSTTKNK